jgi:hypothetical protein
MASFFLASILSSRKLRRSQMATPVVWIQELGTNAELGSLKRELETVDADRPPR